MRFTLSLGRGRALAAVSLLVLALAGCMRSPEAKSAAYLEAGKKQLAKKNPARALLEFRNAVQAMPLNAEAYFQAAQAYSDLRDFKNAFLFYKRATELNPKHEQAQLRMVELMASMGNEETVKMAEDQLKSMTEGSSGNAETFSTLAIAQLKLGRTKDAVQNLEEALAKSPRDFRSAVLLAIAKAQQGDMKGAEQALKQMAVNSPASADPHIILGEMYQGQNRLAEADSEFRRALELDSKKFGALLDLAMVQNAKGEKKEAAENFKKLAASGQANMRSVYAQFLFGEGRRTEAVSEFERIARENPESRPARTSLVAAYEVTNRLPDAKKILDAAIKKNPKDLDALLQRAAVLLSSGKYLETEHDLNDILHLDAGSADAHYLMSRLQQARGQEFSRRQELTQTLRLNPRLIAVRLELAQLLADNKDPKGALVLLDQIPDEAQKHLLIVLEERNWLLYAMDDLTQMRKGIDLGLQTDRNPELLLQDGVWKLRQGNTAGAQAAIEEALKTNSADLRALEVLYDAYGRDASSRALEKVKEYVARQPKAAQAQDFLGMLLVKQGDRTQARRAYDAAKAADPHFVKADFSLAQLDVLEKKWDSARLRLKVIIASDPRNSMAHLWLGMVEQTLGNNSVALGHYRDAVASDAQNTQALNNLASLLAEDGKKIDEALGYSQKASELAPTQPDYADTLGWILYRKGLYDAAVQRLENARSLKKTDPLIQFHLAMAYAKAGKTVRGREVLESALKLNPRLPEAQMAREVVAGSQ